MEAKLIYPKWIGGKAQMEFPKNPIQGQIFRFIDWSKECWEVNYNVYTGNRWVKMRTLDPTPNKMPAVTGRIRPLTVSLDV